jgi:TatD family-associated radical SAM protein
MKPLERMSSVVYWYKGNLYLNITNRCSNNCYFCLRNFRNGISGFKLNLKYEPSALETIQELQNVINRNHWKEVVFCGFGEPTMKIDEVLEITRWIKKYHHNIVRIDTNGHGYLLNPGRKVIEELRDAGVDKVSVSVNASNKELYNQICRPHFENAFDRVLEFVEKSKSVFDTEITFVTVPEVDKTKMKELAENIKVKIRERLYLSPIQ